MKRLALASLLAASLVACGSKSKSTTTTPTGEGDGAAMPAAINWESMDHEARAKYMGQVVLPEMKKVFTEYDAAEFGEMNCATCHGAGAEDHTFKMPNPELPTLTMEAIEHPDEEHKAVVQFMIEKVKPTMAKLLNMPEWTPDNPAGFGCTGCHPFAQ